MIRAKIGLILFLLSFSFFTLSGQDDGDSEEKLHKSVEQAFEAFELMKYTEAIELLKDAYSEVSGRDMKSKVLYMTAECYRLINDYKNAERYYERALKVGYDTKAMLIRGDMFKAMGEYEQAIEVYQAYKKEEPTDAKADQAIEYARNAIDWKDKPSQYQLDVMPDINSSSSDISVIYGGDRRSDKTLVFASAREESSGNKEDSWTGQPFFDLYVTSAERKGRSRRRGADAGEDEVLSYADLKWSTPVPLDEEGILNGDDHDASATYDSRKKKLYFTRCETDKEQKLGCGIYVTEMVGQSWKEPERQIIGSDTMANVGQPSLSPDDKYLYFVSTDYNSRGGRDIFMTTFDRRKKIWAEPTNLGSIVNTEGDERFPVVHDDGYLYFCSDGHPGLGGWDVFRVKLDEDGKPKGEVQNMQAPINSSFDDFGLVWESGGETKRGFISSNRADGGLDDNIYAVYKTPLVFTLEGVVTSKKTGAAIPLAEVKLEGTDGASYTVTASEDGYYVFDETKIQEGHTYNLTFSKKKFLSAVGDVSTVGFELSSFEYIPSAKYFIKRLKLNRGLDPIEEPIVLPNVFFDTDKAFLRPESKVAFDSVVAILNNNPTIVIELRSHTDYIGTASSNENLAQRRADSSVAYLIKKGINSKRLISRGMGEKEPFKITAEYKGYGVGQFAAGTELTERFIKTQSPEKQQIANQINRRTDIKVIRDDFVPEEGLDEPERVDARDVIEKNRNAKPEPGKIYVLKSSRESFGRVAQQEKINIVQLKKLNGGLRGVRPFEGLQLKVEPKGNYEEWDETHYQIKTRGMTIKTIAKELDMDKKELQRLNPDLDPAMLQLGYWIRIK